MDAEPFRATIGLQAVAAKIELLHTEVGVCGHGALATDDTCSHVAVGGLVVVGLDSSNAADADVPDAAEGLHQMPVKGLSGHRNFTLIIIYRIYRNMLYSILIILLFYVYLL